MPSAVQWGTCLHMLVLAIACEHCVASPIHLGNENIRGTRNADNTENTDKKDAEFKRNNFDIHPYRIAELNGSIPLDSMLIRKKVGTALIVEKYIQYTQYIPFQEIRLQLSNLKLNILKLSPDSADSIYEFLDGANGEYLLTSWRAYPSQNFLKCKELKGTAASLQNILDKKLVIPRETLTSDTVRVENNQISCTIDSSGLKGISCLRNLKILSDSLGKKFPSASVNDYYNYLLTEYTATILYVVVNNTATFLDPEPNTYITCKINIKDRNGNSALAARIVQEKYQMHLSTLYEKIILAFEQEINILQEIAFEAALVRKLKNSKSVNVAGLCADIQKYKLNSMHLVSGGARDTSLDEFTDRHQHITYPVISAYKVIISYNQVECVQQNLGEARKILHESMLLRQNLIAEFSGLSAGNKFTEPLEWDMIFEPNTNGKSMIFKFEQLIGRQLSITECTILYISLHNALTRFVKAIYQFQHKDFAQFRYITKNIHQENEWVNALRSHKKRSSIEKIIDTENGVQRTKRWIFTEFLAATSGLAAQESIGKLTNDTVQLESAEKHNEGEILRIESKTNDIIGKITDQNNKLHSLYEDEAQLSSRLTDIIRDEAAISKNLALLVDSLEILSDVQLEYQIVTTILELVPSLINNCRNMVLDVLKNSILPEVSRKILNKGKVSFKSLQHVQTGVKITLGNISVIYQIPQFYPEYIIYRFEAIPFYVEGADTCHTLSEYPRTMAVDEKGTVFDTDSAGCQMREGTHICNPDSVDLRVKKHSCWEMLTGTPTQVLPFPCINEIKIKNCNRQQSLRNNGKIILFTPYTDIVFINCKDDKYNYTVQKGTTIFETHECSIRTSEMEIKVPLSTAPAISLEDMSNDLIGDISDLSETFKDIYVGAGLNLSRIDSDIKQYLESENKKSADLIGIQGELDKFKTVKKLQNFTIFQVDLHKPGSFSNAISGAYVAIIFISIAIFILCCCTCTCCKQILELILKMVISLWRILKFMSVQIFRCILWVNYSDQTEKIETPIIKRNRKQNTTTNTELDDYDSRILRLPDESDLDFSESRIVFLQPDPDSDKDEPRPIFTSSMVSNPPPLEVEVEIIEQLDGIYDIPRSLTSDSIIDPQDGSIITVPNRHGWVRPENFRINAITGKSAWRIEIYHHERALLVKDETYESCTFDGIDNEVRNAAGMAITCGGPEKFMIERYLNLISSLWHPSIKRTTTAWNLEKFPNIEWDATTRKYRDIKTLRTLGGFRADPDYFDTRPTGFFTSQILSCEYCKLNERLIRYSMTLDWDYPECHVVPTTAAESYYDVTAEQL